MNDDAIKSIMKATGNENKHNWLYSFMMINQSLGGESQRDQIYLVGYCKNCDNTVTVLAPHNANGLSRINRAYIPKYGCEPIE